MQLDVFNNIKYNFLNPFKVQGEGVTQATVAVYYTMDAYTEVAVEVKENEK